ncbi:50S ribosomal protein L11 methyltransferase [Bacillus solimangrovi]|uniref:Ribosomal protein L11 methyltransferase n=1 Tax=Bacillus solimangrovi TaxID=1305675 RepID=A0A1E5LDE5_9BACI|nr:50S ribosomal protein L11 methyltransferase [Bacillus solimangrovi]OEH92101.1 hypothetical protein BFG57_16795 [Bacillus solimangrovi]
MIKVEQDKVYIISEKLNCVGLYNLTYDQPIEVEKIQNGYGVKHLEDEKIDFKIYVDENETSQTSSEFLKVISDVLNISKEQIHFQKIENGGWDTSFDDIELENGWVICYSDAVEQYEGKRVIRFDPLAAFGTGLHETTQDCLSLILNHDFSGQSVLDLGTGSGILTVGALYKHAINVKAIDYETVENEVLHNVQLNGISTNNVQVLQEDLLNGDFKINKKYDWIFINIGGDETTSIVQRHDLLEKSDHFLISGLVEWHIEHVIKMFVDVGFTIETKLQTNEWVTIYFKRY